MSYLFLSYDISGDLGEQLFQLSNIYKFAKESRKNNIKRKIVFKKGNKYWNTIFCGLFRLYEDDVYNTINFKEVLQDFSNYYSKKSNIMLKDTTYEFSDDIREKMTKIIYNDEDLMYNAYYKYRELLDYYGKDTKDSDVVCLDYKKGININYYKEALNLIDINNLVVFCDKKDDIIDIFDRKYNIYYVENVNIELGLILYSMFQYNILSDSLEYLWASYISHYDVKKIIAPNKLKQYNNKYVSIYL